MRTILKKELRSFFSGALGYLTVGLLLFLEGIYFSVFQLAAGSTDLVSMLGSLAPVLIFLLPLIPMQTVTAERGGASDLWLRSLPIPTARVCLGKYLASLTVFLLPSSLLLLFPLLLGSFGAVSYATAYIAIGGYLLYGAAFLAFLHFLAFFFCKKLLSFLVGIVAGFGLYFLPDLVSLIATGALASFLLLLLLEAALACLVFYLSRHTALALTLGGILLLPTALLFFIRQSLFDALLPRFFFGADLFSRFLGFTSGRLDLAGILFYLSFLLFFLLLWVLLSKHRLGEPAAKTNTRIPFFKSPRALRTALATLLLTVLILANVLTGLLPLSIRRPDLSGRETFALPEGAESFLASQENPATVYFLVAGGEWKADEELLDYLRRFVAASNGNLTLRVVDTSREGALTERLGATELSDGSLVVESRLRVQRIDKTELYYYYNSYLDLTLTAAEYELAVLAYQSGNTESALYSIGETLVVGAAYTTPYFDGNAALSNAVRFVSQNYVPKLGIYAGAGCSGIEASLEKTLRYYCYDAIGIPSVSALPSDCRVLLMHAPSRDLDAAEAQALREFLQGGGSLWLTTLFGATEMPNLCAILAEYGMSPLEQNKVVCEGKAGYVGQNSQTKESYPYYFNARLERSHPIINGKTKLTVTLLYAHAIALEDRAEAQPRPFLKTSEKGYLRAEGEVRLPLDNGETTAEYTVAAHAQKGDSHLVWCATPTFLDATVNDTASGGNYDTFLSSLDMITENNAALLDVRPTKLPSTVASVASSAFVVWGILLVILLPIGVILFGVLRRALRRRR